MGAGVTRKARADSERNRRRIVEVARRGFAAEGIGLPMREIARRAGVGAATLYRHFPARPDLLDAVLAEQVAACREDVRTALADPDPWRALSAIVRRFGERQLRDRGLNDVLLGSHPEAEAFAEERREHTRALDALVRRARATGAVRPDLAPEDVRVGLMAIASLRGLPPDRAPVAIRRLTELLLAGMR
ncbi:TetR/AcrR family transcriptional regulator [Amycolatopsis thermoflava]|uniref:TetR/AcrR family transcriptional regulator n=1 Tax=Amycolatopsis thermoflava TaxID=84480 RepID=UPI0037F71404